MSVKKSKISFVELLKQSDIKEIKSLKKIKKIDKKITIVKENPQENFDIKYFDLILNFFDDFRSRYDSTRLLKNPACFTNFYFLILDHINIENYFENESDDED